MKKLFVSFLLMVLLMQTISAETIIIEGNSEEVINFTEELVLNSTSQPVLLDAESKKLLQSLVNEQEKLAADRAVTNAMLNRIKEDEDLFTSELNDAKTLNTELYQKIRDKDTMFENYKTDTETKITTLTSRVIAAESKADKFRIMIAMWVLVTIILTICVFEVIHMILKRGHAYFVFRSIRDRIPVNLEVIASIFGKRK